MRLGLVLQLPPPPCSRCVHSSIYRYRGPENLRWKSAEGSGRGGLRKRRILRASGRARAARPRKVGMPVHLPRRVPRRPKRRPPPTADRQRAQTSTLPRRYLPVWYIPYMVPVPDSIAGVAATLQAPYHTHTTKESREHTRMDNQLQWGRHRQGGSSTPRSAQAGCGEPTGTIHLAGTGTGTGIIPVPVLRGAGTYECRRVPHTSHASQSGRL